MVSDTKTIPNHIAIIPDGNRRWARQRALKPWEGHHKGAERIEEIVKEALSLKVKYFTFWGSSEDNLRKRPLSEKKALLNIYEEYFERLVNSKEIFEKKARINVLGRWREQFPKKLVGILSEGIEKTKNHSDYVLTFLLAYNGDDDVLFATQKIVDNAIASSKNNFRVTAEDFKESLLTSSLPNVDLLIRTGVNNDPHNSAGFLMWQTMNSQYYFSDLMFPDFNAKSFRAAIDDFTKRGRRFGK